MPFVKQHWRILTFGLLIALIIVSVLVWLVLSNSSSTPFETKPSTSKPVASSSAAPTKSEVKWVLDSDGSWKVAAGTAPECPPQPMLSMPAETSLVTSVLYPGQVR